ncbi:MAG: ABC transporter ATP-binding protein, partial [Acidobacteriota bacterium]
VMYLGNIVEIGSGEQVYKQPLHPYSRALLSAVPRPDPKATHGDRIPLSGDIPSPIRIPTGCAFHTRCPVVQPSCSKEVPKLEVRDDRAVACPFV